MPVLQFWEIVFCKPQNSGPFSESCQAKIPQTLASLRKLVAAAITRGCIERNCGRWPDSIIIKQRGIEPIADPNPSRRLWCSRCRRIFLLARSSDQREDPTVVPYRGADCWDELTNIVPARFIAPVAEIYTPASQALFRIAALSSRILAIPVLVFLRMLL
jgi:hypothetical protein